MEEIAQLQKELANIEEMHQTTLTQIRNLTSSLKMKNQIESNFAFNLAEKFKADLEQQFAMACTQPLAKSLPKSSSDQIEEIEATVSEILAEDAYSVDASISQLQKIIEGLRQNLASTSTEPLHLSRLKDHFHSSDRETLETLILQELQGLNTTPIKSSNSDPSATSADLEAQAKTLQDELRNVRIAKEEFKREADLEMEGYRKKLKTLTELVEFSKQPSSQQRGLKRMPTIERLEHTVGELKSQITGGGSSENPIRDHAEILKRETAALAAEEAAFKKLKKEKTALTQALTSLEAQKEEETEKYLKRKEKIVNMHKVTSESIAEHKEKVEKAQSKLEKKLERISSKMHRQDFQEKRDQFHKLKEQKTKEVQLMKENMLQEIDSLHELEEELTEKRQNLEQRREALELKRHRLREQADLELTSERTKMEEEKLRVHNLAAELQAAMDKITNKKRKSMSGDKGGAALKADGKKSRSASASDGSGGRRRSTRKDPGKPKGTKESSEKRTAEGSRTRHRRLQSDSDATSSKPRSRRRIRGSE